MQNSDKAPAKRKSAQNRRRVKPAVKTAEPIARTERGKLKALLTKVEERLQSDAGSKVSVSDYIRLLQMKREMDQKKPRDVEVKWVDTLKDEDATEI